MFAIPLNMAFTLRNNSAEPARLALINNVHLMMDLLGSCTSHIAPDVHGTRPW